MGDYDAADSQIKAGVLARDIASDLEDAVLALEEAKKNMADDPSEEDEMIEIIRRVRALQEYYRRIGEAL